MSIRALVDRLGGIQLAKESTWGLGLELVTVVGTFLSFAFLGRSLGPGGYGDYASLYAIVGPLVTLAASGVALALLQHVLRDREPLARTARSCLSLSLVLGTLLTVIGGLIAREIVDTLAALAIVTILLTEFMTVPLIQVAATVVQAATGFIGATQIRIILILIRTVLLCLLFFTDSLTVTTLGVVSLLGSGVYALVLLRHVGRRNGFAFTPGRIHLSHLKSNGAYSVAISASALNNDGDKLVMAANKLVVDTGLYAAAYRVVGFGMIPVGSVVAVSHQRFLHHDEGRRGQHLRRSLKFTAVTALYGVFFAILVFALAPLLPIIVGDDFEGSVEMVRWLAPLVLLRTLAMFPLNGLMGLGKIGLRSTAIVLNAALAMLMYIVLIPIHGWRGAAVATLVSEAILAVVSWGLLVMYQRRADALELAVQPS